MLLLFSCPVVSDSLRGLQHSRLLCPSVPPRVCSDWCPFSWWCHPTISTSVVPFSSRLQSFPASGPLQMSQLFPLGGHSIGASASASVLPMNIQDWFPWGLTDSISLKSKGFSTVFSNTTAKKQSILQHLALYGPTLTSVHDYWKNQVFLSIENSSYSEKKDAAAAAKSLQSCPTLCDPIEGSPPGSPVPGILQARALEWVAISFSNAGKWKVKLKSLSHVWLLVTPRIAAYQAPLSMGFSRQEYWSGLPLPSPKERWSQNFAVF